MSYNTLRALLITSLIVNTLLIGYIIGGATSKQRPKWSPPPMLKDFHRDTFMGGERRLPPMLTQSFKESEQSLGKGVASPVYVVLVKHTIELLPSNLVRVLWGLLGYLLEAHVQILAIFDGVPSAGSHS